MVEGEQWKGQAIWLPNISMGTSNVTGSGGNKGMKGNLLFVIFLRVLTNLGATLSKFHCIEEKSCKFYYKKANDYVDQKQK